MRSTLKTIALSALLCGIALPASARSKPSLPIGDWGRELKGKLLCDRPFLRIGPDLIVRRLEGGEGHCKVTSLKNKNGTLFGDLACDWDKTIPPELIDMGDDDVSGFSLVVKSKSQILFNNSKFGLCSSPTEISR